MASATVHEDLSKDLAGCGKKRYTSVITTFCSVSFFVDSHYAGIPQSCGTWPSSHISEIPLYIILDKLAPPYFHTAVGISSPLGAFHILVH